jgi:hypothetical protein
MKIRVSFYAALLLLLCCSTIYSCVQGNGVAPVAKNGIIDLRQQSFPENIALNGQWLFYWNQLLNPQDTTHKGETTVAFFWLCNL